MSKYSTHVKIWVRRAAEAIALITPAYVVAAFYFFPDHLKFATALLVVSWLRFFFKAVELYAEAKHFRMAYEEAQQYERWRVFSPEVRQAYELLREEYGDAYQRVWNEVKHRLEWRGKPALRKLSPEEEIELFHRYLRGATQEDLAEEYGLSDARTVRSIIDRVERALRAAAPEEESEEGDIIQR